MHTNCGVAEESGAAAQPRRRQRWYRVRVLTEDRNYLGRLRLTSARSLHDLIAEERAYLALWDAIEEGMPGAPEFVAIHKSTIRAVVLLGDAAAPVAAE